jgi:glycosyltransferase involved in cell wall biosynthesis
MLVQITPLLLTFNEAPNVRRTMDKLAWAKEIVIVDSFSTDATVEIAKSYPSVRLFQRKFDQHSAQWNFGVSECRTDWVLALDADHVLTEDLVAELQAWRPLAEAEAYFARFDYCIFGRTLRGSLYPPRAVLFRRDRCRFEQDGHTQRVRATGSTAWLQSAILHDDRKPMSAWLWAQHRYADLEAAKLLSTPAPQLRLQDRLRRWIVPAPLLVLFHALLAKGLILDGWPGWYYVFQRTVAEMILSLKLIEQKLAK